MIENEKVVYNKFNVARLYFFSLQAFRTAEAGRSREKCLQAEGLRIWEKGVIGIGKRWCMKV